VVCLIRECKYYSTSLYSVGITVLCYTVVVLQYPVLKCWYYSTLLYIVGIAAFCFTVFVLRCSVGHTKAVIIQWPR
jgi:hypothetical protein